MAPRRFSRFMFSSAFIDDAGAFVLTDDEPVKYDATRTDTTEHPVVDGDTLFSLAARYYAVYQRPAGLWWVIANFQPDPPDGIGEVVDPTIDLPVGATIYIPSVQFLEDVVFNEKRRTQVLDP